MTAEIYARRFGIILPSVNTVFEREVGRLGLTDSSFHYVRVRAERSSDADILNRMAADAPGAAELLIDVRPETVIYACTSGSLIGGGGFHTSLEQSIEGHTGLSTLTTLSCVIQALRALGVSRVALGTPYLGWVTEQEAVYLEQLGIGVVDSASLGISDGHTMAALTDEQVVDLALGLDSSDAQCLFLSCTNLPPFDVIARIEEIIGKPVVKCRRECCETRDDANNVVANGGLVCSPPRRNSL